VVEEFCQWKTMISDEIFDTNSEDVIFKMGVVFWMYVGYMPV
jgi:hypothetical protein